MEGDPNAVAGSVIIVEDAWRSYQYVDVLRMEMKDLFKDLLQKIQTCRLAQGLPIFDIDEDKWL